jgi:hypothetical protein
VDADYGYRDFKQDVFAHLTNHFGSAVRPQNKAIFIQGFGSRRDADVLVAANYRKYHRFRSLSDQSYVDGICFWTADGMQIVNYPKQHSENCTRKHQGTAKCFKPMVRILKNMRNRMVKDRVIEEGLAPSYFLEGMLYNVPELYFENTFSGTFVGAINWLLETDRSELVCANEQYLLLHDSSVVTWRREKYEKFLNAAADFWNHW